MEAKRFQIDIPESSLIDLQYRLKHTRWPDELNDSKWEYGTNLSYLKELTKYWQSDYNWRTHERKLNEWPQYKVMIDGQEIHFIHVRSSVPNALPIILTHGWPDLFLRFEKIIPLLTEPESFGRNASDAFHVVIPSLPGFSFSTPIDSAGNLFNIHNLWKKLMVDVLGYDKFVAHGGDWGSVITEHLARSHSGHVQGIHLTDVPFLHFFQKPDDLTDAEKKYLEDVERDQMKEGGYSMIQGTRPHTLAAGLNDSPVGLAAWILEKFYSMGDCNGDIESRFTKDQLLTNISLYWHSQSVASSFALYYDTLDGNAFTWIGEKIKDWIGSSAVRTGFAIFKKDSGELPRAWAERFFNVQRWTVIPQGGHFTAMEEPEALANELVAFFKSDVK
jgi:pimeloyl-ACP methyl ester carboxylesterase